MGKQRSRRDGNLRRHLAHLAARLIAEEGVQDFRAAKLKAARQAGLTEAHLLPDNREIEEALRDYQGLYQAEDQPAQLRHLREVAVRVMKEFAQFRPLLVGAVLNGTANQFSEVNLQVFADDPKAFTLFVLNRRHPFDQAEKRVRLGDRTLAVPVVSFEVDDVAVRLSVYGVEDERGIARGRGDAEGPQRARLEEVEALLAT